MADRTSRKEICVIGGGAAGLSLTWALTSQDDVAEQCHVTLIHDQEQLGGHSYTVPVWPEGEGKGPCYPVDLGVQFVCKLMYPNLHEMLGCSEFSGVHLDPHPELKIASTFQPDLNCGNFSAYRDPKNPLFAKLATPELRYECQRFELAIDLSLVLGKKDMTLAAYFEEEKQKGDPYSDAFIDYFLTPYLSILNGYGGTRMLFQATFMDLVPIFLPIADGLHALGNFNEPGRGWQRFRDGSGTWIEAMAGFASSKGATIIRDAPVQSVSPVSDEPDAQLNVTWLPNKDKSEGEPPEGLFDAVVMTTDMTVNRGLLKGNPYYHLQQPWISQKKFPLKGGSCYIHQDESVFPSYFPKDLRDETVQFTGFYAWGKENSLPYDVTQTYSTYVLKNMVPDIPDGWYLSMYGQDTPEKPPADPYFSHEWQHGHFLGSYFYESASDLHHIQGMGNMWFAGNNTLQDSEEGALVSAMVIASKIFPQWKYPFAKLSEAYLLYLFYENEIMFPNSLPYAAKQWLRLSERKAEELIGKIGKDAEKLLE